MKRKNMNMGLWTIISSISAGATCIMFVLYIIGHIWKIFKSKELLYEKFMIENLTKDEIDTLENFVDLDGLEGAVFSISSPNGIKRISVYEAIYNAKKNKFKKGNYITTLNNIGVDEKVYFRTAIPCGIPNKYVELRKNDYIKIFFAVGQSGFNGSFVKAGYKCKITIRGLIYYICA